MIFDNIGTIVTVVGVGLGVFAAALVFFKTKGLETASEISKDKAEADRNLAAAQREVTVALKLASEQLRSSNATNISLQNNNGELTKLLMTERETSITRDAQHKEDREAWGSKSAALEEKILQLSSSITTLSRERDDVITHVTQLQAQVISIIKERDTNAMKISQLQAQVDLLITQRDSLTLQVTALQNELSTLRLEKAQWSKDREQWNIDRKQWDRDRDEWKKERITLLGQLELVRHDRNAVAEEIKTVKSDVEQVKHDTGPLVARTEEIIAKVEERKDGS